MRKESEMSKVTKEAIFEATQAVLMEKGYEKARLADVARKLTITPAALYKHFANRDALFQEMDEDWLLHVDAPILAASERAPEQDRVQALHDWLWLLSTRRQQSFADAPEMLAFYKYELGKHDSLIEPRLKEFASAVEKIMAWDTFRQQRGQTVMQTFTYFYHPFFAGRWDDNFFKTIFETTWQEMLPVVQQGLTQQPEE